MCDFDCAAAVVYFLGFAAPFYCGSAVFRLIAYVLLFAVSWSYPLNYALGVVSGLVCFYALNYEPIFEKNEVETYVNAALELALFVVSITGFDSIIVETNYPIGISTSVLKIVPVAGLLAWYRIKGKQYLVLGGVALVLVVLHGAINTINPTLVNAIAFNISIATALVARAVELGTSNSIKDV